MAIEDKAVLWFIQRFVIPRSQVIDKPGFVIFRISYKTNVYSRQIVVPESLFVLIEKNTAAKYGERGKRILYSIGKRFGYRFATISRVLMIRDTDKKGFINYGNILVKFIEGTYASNISNHVDLENETIKFTFDNFVICRKSGIGFLISVGGIAGICSYMFCNPKIEAVQPKCQGRGDNRCIVISAPKSILKKMGYEVFEEENVENIQPHYSYREMNKIRDVKSNLSLKGLIENNIFGFERGFISYKGERYFIVEASFPYLIEEGIKRLRGGEKFLFNSSANPQNKIGNVFSSLLHTIVISFI